MRIRALLATTLIAGCAAPTTLPTYRLPDQAPLGLFSTPRAQSQLLVDKQEIFPAAYKLIESAQKSVQIDIFLLGDTIGHKVADLLAAKKRAGVDVQLVTDPNLGYAGPLAAKIKPVMEQLKRDGVEVRFYPTHKLKSGIPWLKLAEPVNHAKVLVADRKVAMFGGMNFVDAEAINRDYMVQVSGARAEALADLVDRDWQVSGPRNNAFVPQATNWQLAETAIDRRTIPPLWLNELKQAKRSIDVEMLLMDHPEGVQALIDAHKRGVQVRVLLDKTNIGKHSHPLAEKLPLKGAPNWLALRRLHDAGVPVAWYVPRQRWEMLHAKVCVIDGRVAIMGSANFTERAWHGNRELSVRLDDPQTVSRLGASIEVDWQTRREPVQKLSRWQRAVAAIMEKLQDHVYDYGKAEQMINELPED